jgi:hypothetical protein
MRIDAAFVLMPETSVYFDDLLVLEQNDVWLAWQGLDVKSKSEAQ